jgi:3-deoxy-D-manno-octulosonic-acid transferase
VASAVVVIGSPVWLIGLVARPERWRNRIGLLRGIPERGSHVRARVWVHASSVGEVKATTRVVREMSKRSGVEVVFSTMTAAGHSVAKAEMSEPVYFFYLPLDAPFIQRKVLDQIGPDVLLLVETELWPSLILEAKRKGTKVAVVNGKISAKGFERYRRFECLFGPVLRLLDAVVVQSTVHGRRYEELGVPAERVMIGGNTKQDSQVLLSERIGLKERTGWSSSELVFVAGSTRPEEERIICEGFARARTSLGALRLVLAPRHLRRSASVEKIASSFDLNVARWSELRASAYAGEMTCVEPARVQRIDVLVLDTIGDLVAAYLEGDIAFIGGTLSGHGGHNILEPAAAGLPIIAGPSRQNIEDDSDALSRAGALLTVKSASEVSETLLTLAGSREERLRRGKEALSFYASRPVASLVTVECLQKAGLL